MWLGCANPLMNSRLYQADDAAEILLEDHSTADDTFARVSMASKQKAMQFHAYINNIAKQLSFPDCQERLLAFLRLQLNMPQITLQEDLQVWKASYIILLSSKILIIISDNTISSYSHPIYM